MTEPTPVAPLVGAREAAARLNLPLYVLTDRAKRRELKVPHYRIGRSLRFSLPELETWLLATAVIGVTRQNSAGPAEED